MATEIVPRKKTSPRRRGRPIEGRLIDYVAVNAVCKLEEDDEFGNDRLMDEIQARAVELAGPSPSPLLQSLGLTVALCEHDVRVRHSNDGPLSDRERRQRNLDRSMRRYLAAVKALVVAQRSGLPPIQVNFAERQVVSNG